MYIIYVLGIVCLCLGFNVEYVCNEERKNAKIMNGLIAYPGQFPYMVSLQIRHSGQHFCGGVIINSNYVLTAAHCMYLSIRDKVLLPASKLQVRAGSVNITKDGITARISKIFIHENYESRILDNDIAILRLAGKGFKFSSNIQPVSLSSGFVSNKTLNNQLCTIVGWGHQCGSTIEKKLIEKRDINIQINLEISTKSSKDEKEIDINEWKSSNTTLNSTASDAASLVEIFVANNTENECVEYHDYLLRYAKIPIQNSTECAKDYVNANITDIVICAGLRGGRIDSCKGDSGGPLICNDKVEGIVSFGDGCDNFNHLGVYTRVYNHLGWINKTVFSCASNLKNNFVIFFSLIYFIIFKKVLNFFE